MGISVSIVVPVYIKDETGKNFLKECLDSIKTQSYSDYECIVVDDASPIEIQRLIINHGFRYYRIAENSGIGATRAKGVELAKADWIVFLSHDDKYHQDFLKIMMPHAEKNPDCILYSNYIDIDTNNNVLRHFKAQSFESREDFQLALLAWATRNDTFINADTIVIPKKVFKKIQIDKNMRIGEDTKFYLMAMKYFDFKYIDAYLVFYRRHKAQETLKFIHQIPDNNKKIIEDVKRWWKKD